METNKREEARKLIEEKIRHYANNFMWFMIGSSVTAIAIGVLI